MLKKKIKELLNSDIRNDIIVKTWPFITMDIWQRSLKNDKDTPVIQLRIFLLIEIYFLVSTKLSTMTGEIILFTIVP